MQKTKNIDLRWGLVALCIVVLTACGGGGGAASVGQTPSTPSGNVNMTGLVEVSSLMKGQVSASWLPASDDATTAAGISYELHMASGVDDFTTTTDTLKFSGNALSAVVNGLTVGQDYAVKLVAVDRNSKRYVSAVKKVTVSVADPVANVAVQTVLSPQVLQTYDSATESLVLAAGVPKPAVNSYIALESGDGYLGKVVSVQTQTDGAYSGDRDQ